MTCRAADHLLDSISTKMTKDIVNVLTGSLGQYRDQSQICAHLCLSAVKSFRCSLRSFLTDIALATSVASISSSLRVFA